MASYSPANPDPLMRVARSVLINAPIAPLTVECAVALNRVIHDDARLSVGAARE